MNRRLFHRLVIGLPLLAAPMVVTGRAAAQDAPPVNFDDHIRPIIEEYCIGCHRGSRAKNGLKLESAAGVLEGGSGGPAIVPGDPDGSLLYQVVARTREPFMPFEEDPLPAEMVAAIRGWIESGARESATSAPKAIAKKPAVDLSVAPAAGNKPSGEPAMPQGQRVDPYWWSERSNAITALAASPWAPVIAVGGHWQVVLYHTGTLDLLGVLGYPEGVINDLAYSRNGSILIAAGGESAASGLVVGWDVASGERLFEIGADADAARTADITNDHRLVALGGPEGKVRVFAIESGSMLYEIDKHTDWVTALAFSPDGALLATGDRAGGLFVWETDTGREFYALPPHQPFVTDLSWRGDSNVLATCGEDSAIRFFEMNGGGQIKAWSSHGGALAIEFLADGRLATCGRDRHARLWDGNGTQLQQFEAMADIATELAVAHDGGRVFVGDWTGQVAVFDAASASRIGSIAANPPSRLQVIAGETARAAATLAEQLAGLQPAVDAAAQALAAQAEKATAGDSAAQQAEAQAAEAQTAAIAIETGARQARAAAEPVQSTLAERARARDAAAEAIQAARETAATADQDLQTAIASALAAEKAVLEADEAGRAAARERLDQARKLLEGATALAQLSAARAAECEVLSRRAELEVQDWLAFAQPRIDEAARLAQAAAEARTNADAAQGRAAAARQTATELASVMTQLQQALDDARAQVASAQAALGSARSAAAAAEANWAAQHAAIIADGGRVPVE